MSSLLIIPMLPIEREIIEKLSAPLQKRLHLTIDIHDENIISPMHAFDFTRNQYNSSVLLSHILEQFKYYNGKIVGITGVDLFVPVLTYVFGEAQLDGKAAMVSTFRLDDALYGYPQNQNLFEERILKEMVHEIGHTFGLLHCVDFQCVMHSSTSVEEIDVKGNNFCTECGENVMNMQKKNC